MSCNWVTTAGPAAAGWTPGAGPQDLPWVVARFTGSRHSHIVQEELPGTGTSLALAELALVQNGVPAVEVYFDALRQHLDSTPSTNEYDVSFMVILLGLSKTASDVVSTDYLIEADCQDPHRHVYNEEIQATLELASTPIAGSERLFLNGFSLRRVAAAPALQEYTISGASIALWASLSGGDVLVADYRLADGLLPAHDHVFHEVLSGTGTAFSLANSPLAGSVRLWHNLIRLRQVAASPALNEFTVDADGDIVLGLAKQSGDVLTADYVRAELC